MLLDFAQEAPVNCRVGTQSTLVSSGTAYPPGADGLATLLEICHFLPFKVALGHN